MKHIFSLSLVLFVSGLSFLFGEHEEQMDFWEYPVPERTEVSERLSGAWEELQNSDQVVQFVVDLNRKKSRKSWIVSISEGEVGEAKTEVEESSLVYYASTGDSFEFTTRLKHLKLSTLGPLVQKNGKFSRKSKLNKLVRANVQAPEYFLALGFQDMAEFSLLMQMKERPKSGFNVRTMPYPEEVVSQSKAEFEKLGITSDQIRSMIGLAPSLNSFFNLLTNAPGVSDIIKDVIKKPSGFSLMRNGINITFGGKGEGVRRYNPIRWGLDEGDSCYSLPIELVLNDKTALEVMLIVTTPEGPYRYCAGVVGLIAYTPGDYEQSLIIYPYYPSNN